MFNQVPGNGGTMKEMISYLDEIGHALGIGGFEGVIGAIVIALAAFVIVFRSLSLLRKNGTAIQDEGVRIIPLEWMEDAEIVVGCDQQSKNSDPSWANLVGNSYHNIKHRHEA
jgi:hypothetical protein